MIGGQRAAALALLGVCIVAWIVIPGRMAAQPGYVPAVTRVQGPTSAEPPIAEGYAPATGAIPAGSVNVVDPPIPVVKVHVGVDAKATAGGEPQACRHRHRKRLQCLNSIDVMVRTTIPSKYRSQFHSSGRSGSGQERERQGANRADLVDHALAGWKPKPSTLSTSRMAAGKCARRRGSRSSMARLSSRT